MGIQVRNYLNSVVVGVAFYEDQLDLGNQEFEFDLYFYCFAVHV